MMGRLRFYGRRRRVCIDGTMRSMVGEKIWRMTPQTERNLHGRLIEESIGAKKY